MSRHLLLRRGLVPVVATVVLATLTACRPDMVQPWAAANEGFHFTTKSEALEDAREYDYLVAHPATYAPFIDDMRKANPNLTVVAYVNAMLVRPNEKGDYPNSWFARDKNGNFVRSKNFGNYLLRPELKAWHDDRARTCTWAIKSSGYDGCMLDMLTSAPLYPSYGTGLPVDPSTGRTWAVDDWLAEMKRLAGVVADANPGKVIAGNGFGSGRRYYKAGEPTSVLNSTLDTALTESWLRTSRDGLNQYRNPSEWKQSVDMLLDASRRNTAVLAMVKVWTDGASKSYKDRWHRYALGTFLLGTDGRHGFVFSYDPSADPTAHHPYYDVDLGMPKGRYSPVGNAYQRAFERGHVVVNPTGSSVSVNLPSGSFARIEGGSVSGRVTLPAHTAQILTRR